MNDLFKPLTEMGPKPVEKVKLERLPVNWKPGSIFQDLARKLGEGR